MRSGSISMSSSILYMRYSQKFRMPSSLSTSSSWSWQPLHHITTKHLATLLGTLASSRQDEFRLRFVISGIPSPCKEKRIQQTRFWVRRPGSPPWLRLGYSGANAGSFRGALAVAAHPGMTDGKRKFGLACLQPETRILEPTRPKPAAGLTWVRGDGLEGWRVEGWREWWRDRADNTEVNRANPKRTEQKRPYQYSEPQYAQNRLGSGC